MQRDRRVRRLLGREIGPLERRRSRRRGRHDDAVRRRDLGCAPCDHRRADAGTRRRSVHGQLRLRCGLARRGRGGNVQRGLLFTQPCTTSASCGSNSAGTPNVCVQNVCFPGCTTTAGCAAFAGTSCQQLISGVAESVCTASPNDDGGVVIGDWHRRTLAPPIAIARSDRATARGAARRARLRRDAVATALAPRTTASKTRTTPTSAFPAARRTTIARSSPAR